MIHVTYLVLVAVVVLLCVHGCVFLYLCVCVFPFFGWRLSISHVFMVVANILEL